jgi:hypothetical protein
VTVIASGSEVIQLPRHSGGASVTSEPGISRFRGRCFASPRNDVDKHRRSRDAIAPERCQDFSALRKQRARGMPGAQCTRSLVCAGGSEYAHQYSQRRHRKHPAFPTQWFYGLLRALPGDEFLFATVVLRIKWFHVPGWVDKTSARLSISNGCQDHTTSPYAQRRSSCAFADRSRGSTPALRSRFARNAAASTASRSQRS